MHLEDQIKRFLETFFLATQLEALYFDRKMNAITCHFRSYATENFFQLGLCRLEHILEDIFVGEDAARPSFYTYYLDQNLACNIALLYDNGQCCGAAVTEPVLLSTFKKADFEARLNASAQDSAEYREYLSAVQRAPVVSLDRIRSTGEVLGLLARGALEENECRQLFYGGEIDPALYQFMQSGRLLRRSDSPTAAKRRHGGLPVYHQIKSAISKGNVDALQALIKNFDSRSIHLDGQTSKDAVRSIKNGFIEGFAMCSFIAIEAGAPYGKARDLAEDFIKELEHTENIADMYKLMNAALLAFTRVVALTHIVGHSRPVRQTIEYIEAHYAEKITLKALAERVNLSEFYLSTLVKKETGSNITDIINKVRIDESKAILRKSSVSIGELAARVGYSYSNHFSRVFKQHTGVTPSEYVKMSLKPSDKESPSPEMMNMLLDQLNQFALMFPGVFDVIRVVDPVFSLVWRAQQTEESVEDTCYSFWSRKQSCEKCISRMALEQDRPFVKMDQGKGQPFFVFSAPVTVDGKKYAIELLKGISDNYFDCVSEPPPAP